MIADAGNESLRRASELLRSGRLVAIPTETVYGLAADASNPEAVGRIFTAKGRPADHPLIVHLEAGARLDDWGRDTPDAAHRLAEAFWPGPLTLIVRRQPSVLPVVTGGLDTVALRMPAHPVTQRLLEMFGGGLAAPSANRFGRVSPTTAEEVHADLGDDVDLIIDGGPCEIGVESTIVAWTGDEVAIVRPGGIGPEAIADVLGCRVVMSEDGSIRAPGTLASHYAPSTPVELCAIESIEHRVAELASTGARVGVLSLSPVEAAGAVVAWHTQGDVDALARSLYGYLRRADTESLDVLVVALPPAKGLGIAVGDRLRRAARR